MKPALQARERVRQLATATIKNAPTNGSTVPHLVLSPRASEGSEVTGFSFSVYAPATGPATAPSAGFGLVIWRLNTTLGMWLSFLAYTGLAFNQQLLTYDVAGGTPLYFQLTGASPDGDVVIGVAELT